MTISRRGESAILFIGDLGALVASLFLALAIRYGSAPSLDTFAGYLRPFSFLFAVSILVYFVAGLYDKHTLVLVRRVPQTLVRAGLAIAALATAFFYFLPFFSITPKTFLFIYLILALVLAAAWRMAYLRLFSSNKKQPALLIADGAESDQLYAEVNGNGRYGIAFVAHLRSADEATPDLIREKGIAFVVANFGDPAVRRILPAMYDVFFRGVGFADMRDMYEEVFDRIPLSLIDDSWCLSRLSASSKPVFDLVKRTTDVVVSGIAATLSLIVYPFVYAAIKLDDGGPVFFRQTRVGQRGTSVGIVKFRTMGVSDRDWGDGKAATVTRVGRILRRTRIDELPQLLSVLSGDVSLIGPRPELPDLASAYNAGIPYYNLRHIVKPGLSGWAQIYHEQHPHHGLDTEETANKLSYDLYYVENRSFLLDLKIALRTMKVLLSFAGK